ncbi:hypothetical protein JX265_000475 [Neoarthrinium moseri]|uniref:Uncharacterized protein n=1 Tax=Neoarthrinium moseri TaxID=1658444 RepID=A0A9P9WYH8_9PEZI|nr:hypothetical protein JX265_000475 [Neoarthrinium moseri]
MSWCSHNSNDPLATADVDVEADPPEHVRAGAVHCGAATAARRENDKKKEPLITGFGDPGSSAFSMVTEHRHVELAVSAAESG